MRLFLLRFYPVLFPLIVYLVWLYVIRHRARKAGEAIPKFSDGPIYWMVIASLVIGVFCFMVLGFSNTHNKGAYQPPHMEGDRLVPAQVER